MEDYEAKLEIAKFCGSGLPRTQRPRIKVVTRVGDVVVQEPGKVFSLLPQLIRDEEFAEDYYNLNLGWDRNFDPVFPFPLDDMELVGYGEGVRDPFITGSTLRKGEKLFVFESRSGDHLAVRLTPVDRDEMRFDKECRIEVDPPNYLEE